MTFFLVTDNFRFQSVYPTDTDINEDYPNPAENIVHKAYDSTEHYLETHFRLLRADCIFPVRDAIHSYRYGTVDDNDMTKYINVSIDTHLRMDTRVYGKTFSNLCMVFNSTQCFSNFPFS